MSIPGSGTSSLVEFKTINTVGGLTKKIKELDVYSDIDSSRRFKLPKREPDIKMKNIIQQAEKVFNNVQNDGNYNVHEVCEMIRAIKTLEQTSPRLTERSPLQLFFRALSHLFYNPEKHLKTIMHKTYEKAKILETTNTPVSKENEADVKFLSSSLSRNQKLSTSTNQNYTSYEEMKEEYKRISDPDQLLELINSRQSSAHRAIIILHLVKVAPPEWLNDHLDFIKDSLARFDPNDIYPMLPETIKLKLAQDEDFMAKLLKNSEKIGFYNFCLEAMPITWLEEHLEQVKKTALSDNGWLALPQTIKEKLYQDDSFITDYFARLGSSWVSEKPNPSALHNPSENARIFINGLILIGCKRNDPILDILKKLPSAAMQCKSTWKFIDATIPQSYDWGNYKRPELIYE